MATKRKTDKKRFLVSLICIILAVSMVGATVIAVIVELFK